MTQVSKAERATIILRAAAGRARARRGGVGGRSDSFGAGGRPRSDDAVFHDRKGRRHPDAQRERASGASPPRPFLGLAMLGDREDS